MRAAERRADLRGAAAELAHVEEIGAAMWKGIKLDEDGRRRAMVSLNVKRDSAEMRARNTGRQRRWRKS